MQFLYLIMKEKSTFQQQLESLPGEFTMALDEYRETQYHFILDVILAKYGLAEAIQNMEIDDQQALFDIFESFHNFGFFGGVSFTLNPDVKFGEVLKENQELQDNEQ